MQQGNSYTHLSNLCSRQLDVGPTAQSTAEAQPTTVGGERLGWAILFHITKEISEFATELAGRFSHTVTWHLQASSKPISQHSQLQNTATRPNRSTVNAGLFAYCSCVKQSPEFTLKSNNLYKFPSQTGPSYSIRFQGKGAWAPSMQSTGGGLAGSVPRGTDLHCRGSPDLTAAHLRSRILSRCLVKGKGSCLLLPHPLFKKQLTDVRPNAAWPGAPARPCTCNA